MMKKMHADGFSVVGIVVIVLVIAAIGLGGWYVWNKNKNDEAANKKNSSATQNNANNQSDNTKTQTDPSEGGKYLVINEWEVRIPIPSELMGQVEYGIRKNVQLNDRATNESEEIFGEVAYFTSKELASAPSSACRIDPEKDLWGGVVSISRSTEKPYPFSEIHGKNIDGEWYRGLKGNGGLCYTTSNGEKENALINAIRDAVKDLEVIND